MTGIALLSADENGERLHRSSGGGVRFDHHLSTLLRS